MKYALALAVMTLAACGGTGGSSQGEAAAGSTPRGVADVTTIDFDHVANYAAPALPAYFDGTVAALDSGSAADPIDDKVATLGRVLFYDMRLSTNNRASCASCHQQPLAFSDGMRFSNGISSAATTEFHAMRLANLRYWQPGSMFWNRRVASVETQAGHPLLNPAEMGWQGPQGGMEALIRKMGASTYYPDLFTWAYGDARISPDRLQHALGQFVRSMISSASRWDDGYARIFSPDAPNRALDTDLPNFSPQENRGRHLFMAGVERGGASCAACHLPPTFALAADAHSNGLDAGETRLFKAPSLRSVAVSGPYMHDGRFATLEEVIDFYDHGIQAGPALDPRLRQGGAPRRLRLSADDRAALVAFLKTLTDPVLTRDPRFANPFRGSFVPPR